MMGAITYDEDVSFGVDLDEATIRKCTDIDTLIEWSDDAEAVIEDIKAQITISAMAGTADSEWVYRASKAAGYMSRGKSRIRSRLIALGWVAAHSTNQIATLQRQLVEAKAREAVAVEFLRLCAEGGLDPATFSEIEKRAVALVKDRDANAAAKAKKHLEYQSRAAVKRQEAA